MKSYRFKLSATKQLTHDPEPILFDESEYNQLIDNDKVVELYYKRQHGLEIKNVIRNYYRSKKK